MSVRRDYLLRLIEQFFKFLAIILRLRNEKQYEQASALIDEAGQKFLNIEMNTMVSSDMDTFIKHVDEKSFTLDQFEILAELLKAKAEISVDTNHQFTAINLFDKSLYLFEQINEKSKNYSLLRVNKMVEIRQTLNSLRI
jgi:hypothetical protein